ncbi:MAG: tRNA pseudouridine(38-40) synthase TruA [Solirubrobacteraceae bacterium]|nr:tRNA pseudouridine(38-40) synthase TruA [Solirubrobacteraceae bacterium]
MNSRLLLEYDGTDFAGWATQPERRTVQEELERALATVLREERVPVTVAGRTDRGVHAWGQVCSYAHEAVDPARLNGLLPPDVAVLDSRPAPGFDARGDAVSRTYCYRMLTRRTRSVIWHGRALWWARPIDREALHACAAALVGTHDFTAFTPTQTKHQRFERRVLSAEWREDGELFEFWITADTFMRHMNRVLVGTMLEVAGGDRALEDFTSLLEGVPRSAAGATAPPHGLALARVAYPGD